MTGYPPPSLNAYDMESARNSVADIAIETPAIKAPKLTTREGAAVFLKLENLQVTGSFKVRGAANRMLALTEEERRRGVVTCSSGNHGRAVAYVAQRLEIPATVCVPEWVDPVKLAAIRHHGADAVLHGATYDAAEEKSFEIEKERGLTYVHPFDDPFVIAGQGTIGLELLSQIRPLDAVVVPLSGGGLIAGIAVALKSHHPTIEVIGVSAQNASVMFQSIRAGNPITCSEDVTIANALSGGIGISNTHTFPLVRDYVDTHVLISEEEIRKAMLFAAQEHRLVVEGGGAVGIAAVLGNRVHITGNVAIVVSGGNVGLDQLAKLERS
jgi:threonine dehydratase